MPQPPQQGQPQQGPQVMFPEDMFEGTWANMVIMQRSPHEYTLDFVRLGPQGQQGVVVSRVSFSPVLLGDLAELVQAHWNAYTEEAGIPPDDGIPDEEDSDNG